MRRILASNPDLSNVEKSYLTADYSSGVTLSVVNTFALAADNLIVVGTPVTEKAELKKISAIASDTSLTLASALKFSHSKGDTIYEAQWDFVDIEGNSGSSWALLSQSGLQYDKIYTVFEHSAGTSAWSYRWRFYNSVSATYSEYSPTYAGAGFSSGQVGYMIQNVRKLTNTEDDTDTIRDAEIVRALNAAQDIIYATKNNWWFLRFQANISATASTFRYDLDDLSQTLGFVNTVKYRYNTGGEDTTYQLKFKSEVELEEYIRDNNHNTNDRVVIYTLRPADASSTNGYIEIYPTPTNSGVGTLTIDGFRAIPTLDDAIDSTVIPVPGILENYAIAFVERIRGNDKKAEYYEALFYGPPPSREKSARITGISLLEQLQTRNLPVGQPRQLKGFRGQHAMAKLYGEQYVYSKDLRKNYC